MKVHSASEQELSAAAPRRGHADGRTILEKEEESLLTNARRCSRTKRISIVTKARASKYVALEIYASASTLKIRGYG